MPHPGGLQPAAPARLPRSPAGCRAAAPCQDRRVSWRSARAVAEPKTQAERDRGPGRGRCHAGRCGHWPPPAPAGVGDGDRVSWGGDRRGLLRPHPDRRAPVDRGGGSDPGAGGAAGAGRGLRPAAAAAAPDRAGGRVRSGDPPWAGTRHRGAEEPPHPRHHRGPRDPPGAAHEPQIRWRQGRAIPPGPGGAPARHRTGRARSGRRPARACRAGRGPRRRRARHGRRGRLAGTGGRRRRRPRHRVRLRPGRHPQPSGHGPRAGP